MSLTLGSLFDGIGVFPLAARRAGIRPLWASEIEKGPISITKRHFPEMEHLGDITKLHGGQVPPVDVLTFGSPCQNFSQAGGREGLAGVKSGLFFEAMRIIQEMRDATDGKYPRIAILENVVGMLSASGRMDYAAILKEFAGAEVPMPASGRWANAGLVRGRRGDVAWRVLDAQYWGEPAPLAQRRKRVFVVADSGGRHSAGILFKPRRMLPHPGPCGDRGLPASVGNRIFVDSAGRAPVVHPFQDRRMRGSARGGDVQNFLGSFGKPDDPFPTLLAGTVNMFAFWYGDDYKNGTLRYLSPAECERLLGLPEGWTEHGADGPIRPSVRCKACGNSIALPCADYLMLGIQEELEGG